MGWVLISLFISCGWMRCFGRIFPREQSLLDHALFGGYDKSQICGLPRGMGISGAVQYSNEPPLLGMQIDVVFLRTRDF